MSLPSTERTRQYQPPLPTFAILPTILEVPESVPKSTSSTIYIRSAADLTLLSKQYVKNLEENEVEFKTKFETERDAELLITAAKIGLIILSLIAIVAVGLTLPWSIAIIPVVIFAVVAFSTLFTINLDTNSDNYKTYRSLTEAKLAFKMEASGNYADSAFFKFINKNFMQHLKKPNFRASELCPMHEIYQMKNGKEKQQRISDLFQRLQHYA